jgi:hypothetical protein
MCQALRTPIAITESGLRHAVFNGRLTGETRDGDDVMNSFRRLMLLERSHL